MVKRKSSNTAQLALAIGFINLVITTIILLTR